MHPFPAIMVTVLIALYGLAWHDKPAQAPAPARRARPIDWETVTIWSLVAISFAAFFFAGYILWVRCHGK